MPTSALTFVDAFKAAPFNGTHNLASDVIKVAFTTAANAPVVGDSQLTDLTVIDASNFDTVTIPLSSSTQTGGTYSAVATDTLLTATGGAIPTFRYVVVYNDTATSPADALIGFYDYGSDLTVASGEKFQIDFGATLFTAT